MESKHIIIPEVYVITGENPENKSVFLNQLKKCLEKDYKLIQLRANKLSETNYAELAIDALTFCRQYNARLLLNCDIELAKKLNANGIHLSSSRLLSLQNRRLLDQQIIGASCHNELEILHAQKIGVDFITLSPVLPTKSHPEAKTLGWKNFSKLVAKTDIPVFALGGIKKEEMRLVKLYGGYGIAGISTFW